MSLAERLRHGPPILCDGGLGTMLLARGLPRGAPPERLTLERPAEVESVHRAYVAAGSEAVHTNTFGGSAVRLACFGLEGRVGELNRGAVALARAARARFVLGDVGPTGERLPPFGHADAARWRASFLEQGRALAAAGVDAFHVESMTDVREALVALGALRDAAPEVPVLVSLALARRDDGFYTLGGDPLAGALAALEQAGADAVGANCALTSADMGAFVVAARAAVKVPLVLQPCAGQPEARSDGTFAYAESPETFAADLSTLAPGDARLGALGGCCGTDPCFIAALARRLGRGG
ncbi:MAG: homocysteine S-methyltransferase family protein [Polyangiaceae bacterium]|nr:homocysteine S-methyltransferase family protein [Polyangiaceae bacterium]